MAQLSDSVGGTSSSNIDAYLSDSPEISDSTEDELFSHSVENTPSRMRSLDYSTGKVLFSRYPLAGDRRDAVKGAGGNETDKLWWDQIASHFENFHELLQSVE